MENKNFSADVVLKDLKEIFKGGVLVGIGNIFQVILRYITNIIVTRTVGAEIYGLFTLALTVTSWFTLILPLGLPYAVYRYVPRFIAQKRFRDAKNLIKISIAIVTLLGAVSGFILFLFAGKIANDVYSDARLIPVLKILSVTCLLVSGSIMGQLIVAIRRVDVQVGLAYFITPVTRLILVVGLFLGGLRLYALVGSHILTSFISLSLLVFYSLKLFFRKTYPDDHSSGVSWSEIMKFSIPMFAASIALSLIGIADISILGLYTSPGDIGIYNIGQRLSIVLVFPLSAFNTLYAPSLSEFFAREEKERFRETYRTIAGWSVLGALFFFGTFFFAGREILSIFGREFRAGYYALLILSAGQLINAGTGSVGWILVMSGRQILYLIDIISAVIVNVGLNFLLIPEMGIEGAAIATAFAYALLNILMLIHVWRTHHIHPFEEFYLKKLTVFAISFLIAYFTPIPTFIPAFAVKTLIFMILISVLFLLFARSEEDKEMINAGLRKMGLRK